MARKLADRRYGRPGKASHRLAEQVLRRMPLFGREGDASSPVAVHIYMREMAVGRGLVLANRKERQLISDALDPYPPNTYPRIVVKHLQVMA